MTALVAILVAAFIAAAYNFVEVVVDKEELVVIGCKSVRAALTNANVTTNGSVMISL